MELTIEMPPQMAEEARGYAVLEGMTLETLILKTMSDELMRYRERKAKKAVAVQRMDGISPRVQSLCGIVSLPPDFDEKEFKATRLTEKYEKILRPKSNSNGKSVFDAIRACPVDVDLGKLIPKRRLCGRAHPIDFASLLQEDA